MSEEQISLPSLQQMRKGHIEREFAQVIRQLKGAVDGATELMYLDQTSGLRSENKSKLDEVGGVDGMRVIFRGQIGHLIKMLPKSARMSLPDRQVAAMKLCDEHAARLDGYGEWLTEKSAPYCCRECVYFLSALHLVLQPIPPAVREKVMAAYWQGKDPADVLEVAVVQG